MTYIIALTGAVGHTSPSVSAVHRDVAKDKNPGTFCSVLWLVGLLEDDGLNNKLLHLHIRDRQIILEKKLSKTA